jgi:hypothetical protein
VTATDVRERPAHVVARVRAALSPPRSAAPPPRSARR